MSCELYCIGNWKARQYHGQQQQMAEGLSGDHSRLTWVIYILAKAD